MSIKKTAIILSGGKNSRMEHKTKAFLKFNEKSFIEIVLEGLSSYEEVLVSCNNLNEYSCFKDRAKLIKDEISDIGPLGGIYSCLLEAKFEECLFVATDMPFLNNTLLNYLGSIDFKEDALIPIVNNRAQPLCGLYKRKVIKDIEYMINNKNYKLKDLLDRLNTKYLAMYDEKVFSNINTVEEYEKLKKV